MSALESGTSDRNSSTLPVLQGSASPERSRGVFTSSKGMVWKPAKLLGVSTCMHTIVNGSLNVLIKTMACCDLPTEAQTPVATQPKGTIRNEVEVFRHIHTCSGGIDVRWRAGVPRTVSLPREGAKDLALRNPLSAVLGPAAAVRLGAGMLRDWLNATLF